jgi:nucleoside 2-deoxyribosyltransferase
MAFKVFLSYSTDPEEHAIVWRLQTLATAQGIHVFVPQRTGLGLPSARTVATGPILSEQIRNAIDQSDCVLAIITSSTGRAVESELSYAQGKGKLIIPLVEQGCQNDAFLKTFSPVFIFSRLDGNPGRVETEVFEFLKKQEKNKEILQAVGALVTVGMGLLLLASLSKD